MSNRKDVETLVALAGALSWLELLVAGDKPVQALVYQAGALGLQEAWFYENGSKCKLDVMTLTPETEKGAYD